MKYQSNQRDDESAAVGIVVTVLLIGLAVSVSVMIQNVYVPQWLEEKEAAHMDEVSNQFTELKNTIDMQAMFEQPTSLSSWITLGSRELPIFGIGRTFGTVTLLPKNINITLESDLVDSAPLEYQLGTIEYYAGNTYFIDQSYIYESGSLILAQQSANMLLGAPSFLVTTYAQNISFTIIDINGSIGKRTAAGYGTAPVMTEYKNGVDDIEITLVVEATNITIDTAYPNSWAIALNSTLARSDSGFNSSEYTISTTDNQVVCRFHETPFQGYPTINVKRIRIFSQVSPGWIY